MQSKMLAFLLFLAPALTSPVETASAENPSYGDNSLDFYDTSDSGTSYDQIVSEIAAIPSSILSVMETAIPATWYEDIMDPASRSSLISEIEAGTMPAWYNDLPSGVLAYATSLGAYVENLVSPTADATDAFDDNEAVFGTTAFTPMYTGISASSVGSSSLLIRTTSRASSTNASTASGTTSSTTSSAESSAPASSTSTGGAPIATGNMMVSIAGAAGILGLALAL